MVGDQRGRLDRIREMLVVEGLLAPHLMNQAISYDLAASYISPIIRSRSLDKATLTLQKLYGS